MAWELIGERREFSAVSAGSVALSKAPTAGWHVIAVLSYNKQLLTFVDDDARAFSPLSEYNPASGQSRVSIRGIESDGTETDLSFTFGAASAYVVAVFQTDELDSLAAISAAVDSTYHNATNSFIDSGQVAGNGSDAIVLFAHGISAAQHFETGEWNYSAGPVVRFDMDAYSGNGYGAFFATQEISDSGNYESRLTTTAGTTKGSGAAVILPRSSAIGVSFDPLGYGLGVADFTYEVISPAAFDFDVIGYGIGVTSFSVVVEESDPEFDFDSIGYGVGLSDFTFEVGYPLVEVDFDAVGLGIGFSLFTFEVVDADPEVNFDALGYGLGLADFTFDVEYPAIEADFDAVSYGVGVSDFGWLIDIGVPRGRRFYITADESRFPGERVYVKTSEGVLDFEFVYGPKNGSNDGSVSDTGLLQGDEIVSASVFVQDPDGQLKIDSHSWQGGGGDPVRVRFWVSGGIRDAYFVIVETRTAGGRTYRRALTLYIQENI